MHRRPVAEEEQKMTLLAMSNLKVGQAGIAGSVKLGGSRSHASWHALCQVFLANGLKQRVGAILRALCLQASTDSSTSTECNLRYHLTDSATKCAKKQYNEVPARQPSSTWQQTLL